MQIECFSKSDLEVNACCFTIELTILNLGGIMGIIQNSRSSSTGTDCYCWIQKNEEQIKTHEAWHANLPEAFFEEFLKNQPPLTYLLRSGPKEQSYFISFVQQDGTIKHKSFVLEFDHKGWYYRNGVTNGLKEVTMEDLQELIPIMMHCEPSACIPLTSTR